MLRFSLWSHCPGCMLLRFKYHRAANNSKMVLPPVSLGPLLATKLDDKRNYI